QVLRLRLPPGVEAREQRAGGRDVERTDGGNAERLAGEPALAQPLPRLLRRELQPRLACDALAMLLQVREASVGGVPVLCKPDVLADVGSRPFAEAAAQPVGVVLAALQFENGVG